MPRKEAHSGGEATRLRTYNNSACEAEPTDVVTAVDTGYLVGLRGLRRGADINVTDFGWAAQLGRAFVDFGELMTWNEDGLPGRDHRASCRRR